MCLAHIAHTNTNTHPPGGHYTHTNTNTHTHLAVIISVKMIGPKRLMV
jgi:hypothetical protein